MGHRDASSGPFNAGSCVGWGSVPAFGTEPQVGGLTSKRGRKSLPTRMFPSPPPSPYLPPIPVLADHNPSCSFGLLFPYCPLQHISVAYMLGHDVWNLEPPHR